MINDTLTGNVPGGNGTQIDVSTALFNGPLKLLIGSSLLYDLWYSNTVPVNLGNNPTAGAGTRTFVQNGVETIWIDPAIYPGAPPVTKNGEVERFASQNIDQLGERIGHELAHAEIPDANDDYTAAHTLGEAVAIGETDEAAGYTTQYVIAEQLLDIGNTANPENTSFNGLNKVFHALQAVAAEKLTFFLTVDNVSELIDSDFYERAVGTLAAPGPVALAIASLQSQAGKGPAFTQVDKWQDQWILANVYHITGNNTGGPTSQTYSYALGNITHSCISVKGDGSGGWTFERTGLSRDKQAVIERTRRQASDARLQISDLIRDPYVLEFVGLAEQPRYTESDLETALLDHIQTFLLDLGSGFCFEARQKRITVGNEHDYIDLVFYHRLLHCHLLIDLKVRHFQHGDAGQMNFYLNYCHERVYARG